MTESPDMNIAVVWENMRVSVLRDDPGYSLLAFRHKVFLNGVEVVNPLTADEEMSVVLVYKTNKHGKFHVEQWSGEIAREWKHGRVKIVKPDIQPNQLRGVHMSAYAFPLYRARHVRKTGKCHIKEMRPATGKEKHINEHHNGPSISPMRNSKYGRHRLSKPAIKLQEAITGDDSAEVWLTAYLADRIKLHAKANLWKLGLTWIESAAMAEIALYPVLFGIILSDNKASKVAGVNKSAYQNNWKPKIKDFQPWINGWIQEIEQ